MTAIKNGWKTAAITVLLAIVMASSGYIVRSTAGDIEKLELKDSAQSKRMDTIDARVTKQLYEFRILMSEVNAEIKAEAKRAQWIDSLVIDKLDKIDEKIGF